VKHRPQAEQPSLCSFAGMALKLYHCYMKEKTLQDLTKEEIGQLFPIKIDPYSKNWPDVFEKEKNLITDTLEPGLFSRIEHFGSTSVPGLSAKDTIDILKKPYHILLASGRCFSPHQPPCF